MPPPNPNVATDSEAGRMPDCKLGDSLDGYDDAVVRMPPPVVFRSQPDSYVMLRTPEQHRA
ncbi:hypothetical protein GCM10010221_28870 [Streptomyces parvus]|nr:hypothetical protein GCM10010221_28870 [Streptomyces parvus]